MPLTPIKLPSQIQMLPHKYFANYGRRHWAVVVAFTSFWSACCQKKAAAAVEREKKKTKRRQSIDRLAKNSLPTDLFYQEKCTAVEPTFRQPA